MATTDVRVWGRAPALVALVALTALLRAVPLATADCTPDCTGSGSVSCLYCSVECGVCDEIGAVDRCVQPGTVHLTIDDGPRGTTPVVLDILRHYNVSATFFVIGNLIAGREHMLHRMAVEGHRVADHTWSHPNMNTLNDTQQMRGELVRSRDEIVRALASLPANASAAIRPNGGTNPRDPRTGAWLVPEYRPPYGELNRIVRDVVEREGYQIAVWNLDTFDWSWNVSVIGQAMDTAMATFDPATNSFVVLMHLTERIGVCTLPAIIERVRARGYEWVSADECWGAAARDTSRPLNRAVAEWRDKRTADGTASPLCQPPTMQAQSWHCNASVTCYSPEACCGEDGSCGHTEWQCGEGCVSGACAQCVPHFMPAPLLAVAPLDWPDPALCPAVPIDDLPHLPGDGVPGGGDAPDEPDDGAAGTNATAGIIIAVCVTAAIVVVAAAARDSRVIAKCRSLCARRPPPPAPAQPAAAAPAAANRSAAKAAVASPPPQPTATKPTRRTAAPPEPSTTSATVQASQHSTTASAWATPQPTPQPAAAAIPRVASVSAMHLQSPSSVGLPPPPPPPLPEPPAQLA